MSPSNVAAGVEFLPMGEDDLDWVAEAERALHAFPWSRGNFADSLAAGYSCWIMKHDGHAIGYGVMMLILDEAHLLDISIARTAQGTGMGRELLDFLRSEARQRGAAQFFLEVRPSNEAALALYRKADFVQIGRRRGYYPAIEGREDAIVMRCSL